MTTTPPSGKPPCDWDDPAAREALVDALVRDCQAALAVLDGQELTGPLVEAAELLALVAGQDVEARRGRGVPDRPAGGPGSGDLHRGHRRPGTGTSRGRAPSTGTRPTSASTRTTS